METDLLVEEGRGSESCNQDSESEEFYMLLQQQKYLNNLTETALRKNQPLIILNLMHEKVPLLLAEDLTGTHKSEKMCLEALSMRTFPGWLPMEISMANIQSEDQDVCGSSGKATRTHTSTAITIKGSDMPIIQKFPTVPKSQLRNKVREISDFVDNHWQVKKEILDEIGISISPAKGGIRMQNISTFFSKRCLPPAGKSINPIESSPQSSLKSDSVVEGQQAFTCSHL
ncbi:hypothetical protein GH714_000201 [Hevea brasiliensis]|uniref:Chromatin assembly factor 1 subunit Cac1-like C-terminal domain-containing protein n=1 Tax=Hevea brasiliensis TaxID=3981 RepID=A0A6A6KSN5_HEVBR|nr:hypothetical protein GH714_000201 [Hevea brasiliensis]